MPSRPTIPAMAPRMLLTPPRVTAVMSPVFSGHSAKSMPSPKSAPKLVAAPMAPKIIHVIRIQNPQQRQVQHEHDPFIGHCLALSAKYSVIGSDAACV